MILEVCCGNLESVKAAVEGGADRIELCRNLELDGLTPCREEIKEAVRLCHSSGVLVHVLIRSRAGNFVYDEAEVAQMEAEIRTALEEGADGIVIGALSPEGDIDVETCKRWIDAAHNAAAGHACNITFHRAFDVCRKPLVAIEQIVHLGCNRILTSGQSSTAELGVEMLGKLVERSHGLAVETGHSFDILCGGGVTTQNAWHILRATGATEIHGSLRTGSVSDVRKIRELKSNNNQCFDTEK